MPQMQLTTKGANLVWTSPDGQRKIYELEMDYNGQPVKAKTYSEAIATVGWSGLAETYEKEGKPGMPAQTFVKQPPKENGYSGSGSQYTSTGRGSGSQYSGSKSFQSDPFTMYLSYAKDIAVALIGTKAYTPERLGEIVAAVSLAGEQLYDSRPDGPTRQAEKTGEDAPKKLDEVHTVPDGPIDLSLVEKVFGGEPEQEQETPWPTP